MSTSSITKNFAVKTKAEKKSLEKALASSGHSNRMLPDTDKFIKKGEKQLDTILSHYDI
ncbi:MAG: hypothetical protein JW925_11450 [Syntrophaceae bacterium]|nr:hypothetical protein [Syntrophaceae bacterium]